MRRFLVCFVLIATALAAGRAFGQTGHATGSLALIGVHPETMADVIVVLEPQQAFPLNVPTPGEQSIRGSVLRGERGGVPQLIVNTPNTIVAPLPAGVPVRLYLKPFSNRNAHDRSKSELRSLEAAAHCMIGHLSSPLGAQLR